LGVAEAARGVAPPLVPTIVGPTAVGKTALVEALAEHLPLTVVSADARQVYIGLDVGTAKPDAELRWRVPHRGLDLVQPGEPYSAGRFSRDATDWIEAAAAEGRQAVVVGGTGLYVRALADGLFREPPLDASRRDALRRWSADRHGGDIARWAARLDARYGGGGRQRAARVVEIALLTGRSLSWWQQAARETGTMRPWYVRLTLPRDALYRRIDARVDRMLEAGLVEETRAVLARGVPPDAPGLDAVGYREVVAMLCGRLPAAELRDAIITATRRYAKRQETWFRNQLGIPDQGGRPRAAMWALDAAVGPERLGRTVFETWARAAGRA
jgi:tRNA dimethylallyltransferase